MYKPLCHQRATHFTDYKEITLTNGSQVPPSYRISLFYGIILAKKNHCKENIEIATSSSKIQ